MQIHPGILPWKKHTVYAAQPMSFQGAKNVKMRSPLPFTNFCAYGKIKKILVSHPVRRDGSILYKGAFCCQ
jgi:hypothetical protein